MAADVSPSEVEMYQGAAKIEGILNYATHLPNAVSMRSISFLKPVSSTLLLFLVALPGTSDSVWRIVARSKSTIIGRLQVEFHNQHFMFKLMPILVFHTLGDQSVSM
ncbi:predicted protein [Histoplasma mississippiense (nom. inval.)]|uniref:predicted protein n=1 Tax=Ajellomyces capsulatus (strain NAm1 / WU24) TaxID=2059318 RepID=UPI000157CAFE|nr:predicted protein [Histoplasma mississippiense (nom. inval.)]EDN09788.1 predicted protein [Histoplasma mississippiense (nom. inval.)]